jgi:hypothetical protein
MRSAVILWCCSCCQSTCSSRTQNSISGSRSGRGSAGRNPASLDDRGELEGAGVSAGECLAGGCAGGLSRAGFHCSASATPKQQPPPTHETSAPVQPAGGLAQLPRHDDRPVRGVGDSRHRRAGRLAPEVAWTAASRPRVLRIWTYWALDRLWRRYLVAVATLGGACPSSSHTRSTSASRSMASRGSALVASLLYRRRASL